MDLQIIDFKENIGKLGDTVINFSGSLNETIIKQSFTSKRTIGGKKRTLFTNPYKSIVVTIEYMDKQNYMKLIDLFIGNNPIQCSSEDGDEFIATFSDSSLKLSKKRRKTAQIDEYYYDGTFNLEE